LVTLSDVSATSAEVIHRVKTLTLMMTLMMTSAQVVETSVGVTISSPSQDYTHPDDHNLPTYQCILHLYTI